MHTFLVIAGGIVLLGFFIAIARNLARSTSAIIRACWLFVPVWLIFSGLNLWSGMALAGYSLVDEVPFFLAVFFIPTVIAVITAIILKRRLSPQNQ
jgi:hypothetical protein